MHLQLTSQRFSTNTKHVPCVKIWLLYARYWIMRFGRVIAKEIRTLWLASAQVPSGHQYSICVCKDFIYSHRRMLPTPPLGMDIRRCNHGKEKGERRLLVSSTRAKMHRAHVQGSGALSMAAAHHAHPPRGQSSESSMFRKTRYFSRLKFLRV